MTVEPPLPITSPKTVSYTFRARTPIWTGDVTGQAGNEIRETGILGSLRWWFEVLARGVGADVPAPSQAGVYDPSRKHGGLDPVSYLFGATGWRRQFDLRISHDGDRQQDVNNIELSVADKTTKTILRCRALGLPAPTAGAMNRSRWYYKGNQARTGNICLQIRSRVLEFNPAVIGGVLRLVSRWSAFAAKTQLGLGVIGFEPESEPDGGPLLCWLKQIPRAADTQDVPRLDRMFFARLSVAHPPFPYAQSDRKNCFAVKHEIRELWRATHYNDLRHHLMGFVSNHNRMGAKISMSWPYQEGEQWKMRVWGWIPCQLPGNANREDDVMVRLHTLLSAYDSNLVWREFNAPTRDPNPHALDPLGFVERLLT